MGCTATSPNGMVALDTYTSDECITCLMRGMSTMTLHLVESEVLPRDGSLLWSKITSLTVATCALPFSVTYSEGGMLQIQPRN